jgi:hypothetical protein
MLGLVKKIAVGICGDAKDASEALTERLAGRELACDATRAERAEQIASEKAAWEKELDEWTHEKDPFSLDAIDEAKDEKPFSGGEYLHPRQVLRELEKAMPEDVMVSTDIGNINAVAHSYLRFDKPRSFFAPMSFGNCGYALPTIIGAKVAAPHRPAIAYAGDGAWGMSLMETSARFRSFWCSSMRKPGLKVRLIMRSPCTSRMRLLAKPPISAWRTLAGSAPALLANSSASATASMLSATMIWLATLVVWPSPLPPTSVMFLPISSNSGLTRSNTASGPPTMMVRLAALAPTSPPLTGASR